MGLGIFQGAIMKTLAATFVGVAEIGVALVAVLVAYLGYRVIEAIRVYFRFRGTRLVTCPETHESAVVQVAARAMAAQAIMDEPCLSLSECSRWPIRRGCGQDCLKQIEAPPSEMRISAAWRALKQ
jgi:hypothetical protein